MRLRVTWDGNDDGSKDVLQIGRKPITVWLSVASDGGNDPPRGVFAADDGATVQGQPDHPRCEVTPNYGGRTLTLRFHSSDDRIRLEKQILVVRRWVAAVSASLMLLAAVVAGLGIWISERALGAFFPDPGVAKQVVVAVGATVLGALGVTGARAVRAVWRIGWCLGFLALALVVAALPQLIVYRIDNGTRTMLELPSVPPVAIEPGASAIVRTKLIEEIGDPFSTADGKGNPAKEATWWRQRLYCASVDGRTSCEVESLNAPLWEWLPFWNHRVIGCDATNIADEFLPAWRKAPRCRPDDSFEDHVVRAGVTYTVRPFEASRAEAITNFDEFLKKYRTVQLKRVGAAASDLTLEFTGQGPLRKVLFSPSVATTHIPARPEDRTVLATARITNIEVGSLSCVFHDSGLAKDLMVLSGSPRTSRFHLFERNRSVSAFILDNPSLSAEVPLCRPPNADRLEIFLAPSWHPSGWHLDFPKRTVPETIRIFLPDERAWGRLECMKMCPSTDCRIQPLRVRTTEAVEAAQYPEHPPEGAPLARWTSESGNDASFREWFWTCGPSRRNPGPDDVSESATGDKAYVDLQLSRSGYRRLWPSGELTGRGPKACPIDPHSGREIPGRKISTCNGGSAESILKHQPVDGCDTKRSQLCP